jgi:hypothetical protein
LFMGPGWETATPERKCSDLPRHERCNFGATSFTFHKPITHTLAAVSMIIEVVPGAPYDFW